MRIAVARKLFEEFRHIKLLIFDYTSCNSLIYMKHIVKFIDLIARITSMLHHQNSFMAKTLI